MSRNCREQRPIREQRHVRLFGPRSANVGALLDVRNEIAACRRIRTTACGAALVRERETIGCSKARAHAANQEQVAPPGRRAPDRRYASALVRSGERSRGASSGSVKSRGGLEHSPRLAADLAFAVEVQRRAESHADPLVLAPRTCRVGLAVRTTAVWVGGRAEIKFGGRRIAYIQVCLLGEFPDYIRAFTEASVQSRTEKQREWPLS
jgi:hypothetical protein